VADGTWLDAEGPIRRGMSMTGATKHAAGRGETATDPLQRVG
jgi:hypothetical protein